MYLMYSFLSSLSSPSGPLKSEQDVRITKFRKQLIANTRLPHRSQFDAIKLSKKLLSKILFSLCSCYIFLINPTEFFIIALSLPFGSLTLIPSWKSSFFYLESQQKGRRGKQTLEMDLALIISIETNLEEKNQKVQALNCLNFSNFSSPFFSSFSDFVRVSSLAFTTVLFIALLPSLDRLPKIP